MLIASRDSRGCFIRESLAHLVGGFRQLADGVLDDPSATIGGLSGTPITAIVPTVELHLNSPLNNLGDSDLNATLGAHLQIGDRMWLGLGTVVPLTGPKPFDSEAIATFNFRF